MLKKNLTYLLFAIIICTLSYLLYKILSSSENMQTQNTNSYVPTHISTSEGNDICDVFYNPFNEIVIVMPIKNMEHAVISINGSEPLEKKVDSHGYTLVYTLKTEVYEPTVNIKINEHLHENIRVNKLPDYEGKIVMTTCVKNEDAYVKQWIRYNKSLGIQQFVFYDNEQKEKSKLANTLAEYISDGSVLIVEWSYSYSFAQFAQMNHSLYGFRNAKYIAYFDIDEYINPQCEYHHIDKLLDHIMQKRSVTRNDICAIRFYNRFFYNPDNKPTNDYEFLKITTCSEVVTNARHKMFVLPLNVDIVAIHIVSNPKNGIPQIEADESDVFFNHYMYLNKPERGKENTKLKDDSIHKILKEFDIL